MGVMVATDFLKMRLKNRMDDFSLTFPDFTQIWDICYVPIESVRFTSENINFDEIELLTVLEVTLSNVKNIIRNLSNWGQKTEN